MNAQDTGGRDPDRPWGYRFMQLRRLEVVQLLLDRGADPNARDENNQVSLLLILRYAVS